MYNCRLEEALAEVRRTGGERRTSLDLRNLFETEQFDVQNQRFPKYLLVFQLSLSLSLSFDDLTVTSWFSNLTFPV